MEVEAGSLNGFIQAVGRPYGGQRNDLLGAEMDLYNN